MITDMQAKGWNEKDDESVACKTIMQFCKDTMANKEEAHRAREGGDKCAPCIRDVVAGFEGMISRTPPLLATTIPSIVLTLLRLASRSPLRPLRGSSSAPRRLQQGRRPSRCCQAVQYLVRPKSTCPSLCRRVLALHSFVPKPRTPTNFENIQSLSDQISGLKSDIATLKGEIEDLNDQLTKMDNDATKAKKIRDGENQLYKGEQSNFDDTIVGLMKSLQA
jgi:hypothetical protein